MYTSAIRMACLETGCDDHVFDKSYRLRAIEEVAAYIRLNKHLLDVPSAAEVQKKGIQVGQANTMLLKKIDELTLYLIEQDNGGKDQQLQIDKLAKRQLVNNRTAAFPIRLQYDHQAHWPT